ncbi:MAG: methyltransferase, FxLD system, partial [Gammaproteobacteria bacterium]
MSPFPDTNVNTADQADALRTAMIAELREMKAIRNDRVAEAFRAVPRHLFAPGEPLEMVYAPTRAIVTKRNEHGTAISSLSEPDS